MLVQSNVTIRRQMKFKAGDDVTVNFRGQETAGEVLATYKTSGFILTKIQIDPELDYGEVSAQLDPQTTVCVRESEVQHA